MVGGTLVTFKFGLPKIIDIHWSRWRHV